MNDEQNELGLTFCCMVNAFQFAGIFLVLEKNHALLGLSFCYVMKLMCLIPSRSSPMGTLSRSQREFLLLLHLLSGNVALETVLKDMVWG